MGVGAESPPTPPFPLFLSLALPWGGCFGRRSGLSDGDRVCLTEEEVMPPIHTFLKVWVLLRLYSCLLRAALWMEASWPLYKLLHPVRGERAVSKIASRWERAWGE